MENIIEELEGLLIYDLSEQERNGILSAIEIIKNYIELTNTIEDIRKKDVMIKKVTDKIVEQYKRYIKIGTVEEYMLLKEKSEPKKVVIKGNIEKDNERYYCPLCNSRLYTENIDVKYCNCGQAITMW